MCDIWINKFFNYCKTYKKLLRIDEDCNIKTCNNIYEDMSKNNIVYTYKLWEKDKKYVTYGLREFSNNFINKNNLKPKNNFKTKIPSVPYTNVFAIDLE